jgi:sulfate/thiosulfate-binding protein
MGDPLSDRGGLVWESWGRDPQAAGEHGAVAGDGIPNFWPSSWPQWLCQRYGLRGSREEVAILLASFAVTRDAYRKIVPAFEAHWLAKTGQRVRVESSYGGSATQSRAVIDGLDADVVALALALDVERLVAAGLIQPGWEARTPNQGIVTRSVAVIVTREGNPQGIRSWQDLARPGLQVVTANPKTSGGARWNFLALWSAVPEPQALAFTTQVYKNVRILPRDSREATDVFFQKGQGMPCSPTNMR